MSTIFLEFYFLFLQYQQVTPLPLVSGDDVPIWRWIVSTLVIFALALIIEIKIGMKNDRKKLIEKDLAIAEKDRQLVEKTDKFNEKYLQLIKENAECQSQSITAMNQLTGTVRKIDETMNAILNNLNQKIHH